MKIAKVQTTRILNYYMTVLAIIFSILIQNNMAAAETLKSFQLEDQFGVKTTVNESTEWIIFSDDKEVSDKINLALNELKITDVSSLKGIYVAEISKMPSIITSMFALPKMREYKFKLLLDKEGVITKTWPREKAKATILKLKNLEITEKEFAATTEELKKFLKTKLTDPKL
jgi:hypothetical protein